VGTTLKIANRVDVSAYLLFSWLTPMPSFQVQVKTSTCDFFRDNNQDLSTMQISCYTLGAYVRDELICFAPLTVTRSWLQRNIGDEAILSGQRLTKAQVKLLLPKLMPGCWISWRRNLEFFIQGGLIYRGAEGQEVISILDKSVGRVLRRYHKRKNVD
jgi:hypothetical protein